jgi:hypothetical protein
MPWMAQHGVAVQGTPLSSKYALTSMQALYTPTKITLIIDFSNISCIEETWGSIDLSTLVGRYHGSWQKQTLPVQ